MSLAVLILQPQGSSAEAVPITELARLEAADRIDVRQTETLIEGYLSLGFPREAAARLERMIRLGELPRDEARHWFEELAAGADAAPADDRIAIGEAAARSGVVSPLILYSYGSGLRQAGRRGEAQAVFSRIPAGDPWHPFALYALGQVLAEGGEFAAARDVFDRLSNILAQSAGNPLLSRRVRRSHAELLLVMGRNREAEAEFGSLARETEDPMARIGLLAAGQGTPDGAGKPLPETIAGWAVRDRVLYSLLTGSLAGERGDLETARTDLARAEDEIRRSLESADPPVLEPRRPGDGEGIVGKQLDHHTALRQAYSREPVPDDPETVRTNLVELLGGLLVLDRAIGAAVRSVGSGGEFARAEQLSPDGIDEILDAIETTMLDGLEVDRVVKEFGRRLDVLQNLAHPIHRYRLLGKLEKGQAEIQTLRERIARRRSETASRLTDATGKEAVPVLADLGRLLAELDSLRSTATEILVLTREKFNIIRWDNVAKGMSGELPRDRVRAVLSLHGERFASLARAHAALEAQLRREAWERDKGGLRDLRSLVLRSACDILARYARTTRQGNTGELTGDGWAALEQVVSHVRGGHMDARGRIEAAIRAAAVLVEGSGRWRDFPERPLGERETPMIEALLPSLEEGARAAETREESLFLAAMVRMRLGDPGGGAAAREFLEAFPSSPQAGDVAVRLGHDALMKRQPDEARRLYKIAAGSADPEASAVGLAMRGWMMFQEGDAPGATKELSAPLADPSFRCDDPSPFEEAALALAVRAWQEASLDGLRDYLPVQRRSCGGRLLLVRLGDAETRRGETARAATTYDVFTQRFADDRAAPEYERKVVEGLLRTGQESRAVERALQMSDKFGPGSPWSGSRPEADDRKARAELAEVLESLSEKKFEEGIRSGDQAAMSTSAEIMGRLFSLKGDETSPSDAELRLKWAVASLQSGDRGTAVLLLEELLGEDREDAQGEKAAIIYADTMIASYERKEQSPDDAEDAALYLMQNYPSEKAASMGLRAALGFFEAGDFTRAGRMAAEVLGDRSASRSAAAEAGLIRARIAAEGGDFRSARINAAAVLDGAPEEADAGLRGRAQDLYLLAALREADSLADGGDFRGAAERLEEVLRRFPGSPEAPAYLLRAVRMHRIAGDTDGLLRTGGAFLSKYPNREECLDVAGTLGAHWEERGEPLRAAEVLAETSRRFPPGEKTGGMLFRAATLFRGMGRDEDARKGFSAYRAAYSNPKWMMAYASLAVGLADWKAGRIKTAVQGLEDGIRLAEGAVEKDAPEDLFELAGQARLAIGEYWIDQFRGIRLAPPLEKNLALKSRFFKRALGALEKAETESPFSTSINAVLRSGDLFMEFGKAIRDSRRPKGLKGDELRQYEEELGARSRTYVERALELYEEALARLEAEEGPSDLAVPIRQRMEETQTFLQGEAEKSP